MKRGVYRGIFSALPDDPDFQQLSPSARLTLYTLRVCTQAGRAVIFRFYREIVCRQTGLTPKALEAALADLVRGNWIAIDDPIVWVRNGLKYDPYTTLVNEKHKLGVLRDLQGLPKRQIVLTFCDYYSLPYPFERASIGSHYREGIPRGDTDTEKDILVELPLDGASSNGTYTGARNLREEAQDVLNFLNAKTGHTYRPVPENLRLIEARLKSGASVDALRGVVARKSREWSADPAMKKFLRPATLFNATKCEQYLGEREATT